jgi:ATP-dependent RNA helicase RhlE
MTKQKIADGDLMGFDASTIEAEKPEVRERPDMRNPRNARGPRGDGPNGGGGGGGRKDKGKDKGKEKPAGERGERPARQQKPREGTPAREQRQPSQPPRAAADRAPDEFLDDDIDNFGNRVDYVPKQAPAGGRGRRPGAPAQGAGAGAPRGGQSQGRQNGPRNSNGSSTGTPPGKRSGPRNGAPRDGQGRRDESSRNRRPARDDQQRAEPAVQNPRSSGPKIMHKESKADRFPTPEQLDQLPSRPRGEKPALLTRNR